MPYRHIEQIRDRKGEKMFAFLTMENTIGVVGGAGTAFVLTVGWPLVLRTLIVLIGAAAGALVTFDMGGIPGYARIMWWLRGRLRMLTTSTLIDPDDLMGAKVSARRDTPLRVGGPVQLVQRERVSDRVSRAVQPVAAPIRAAPPPNGDPVAESSGTDPVAESSGTDPVAESSGTDPVAESSGTDPVAESSGATHANTPHEQLSH